MKAWRFYAFGDMRLDDVPVPPIRRGHVLAEILCVQPSVTEAQLAFGIPTLAFEAIKQRLETEAPVQLFGHEYCARILETGARRDSFQPGDRVAARAKASVRPMRVVLRWPGAPVPQRTHHRLSAAGVFRRIRRSAGDSVDPR